MAKIIFTTNINKCLIPFDIEQLLTEIERCRGIIDARYISINPDFFASICHVGTPEEKGKLRESIDQFLRDYQGTFPIEKGKEYFTTTQCINTLMRVLIGKSEHIERHLTITRQIIEWAYKNKKNEEVELIICTEQSNTEIATIALNAIYEPPIDYGKDSIQYYKNRVFSECHDAEDMGEVILKILPNNSSSTLYKPAVMTSYDTKKIPDHIPSAQIKTCDDVEEFWTQIKHMKETENKEQSRSHATESDYIEPSQLNTSQFSTALPQPTMTKDQAKLFPIKIKNINWFLKKLADIGETPRDVNYTYDRLTHQLCIGAGLFGRLCEKDPTDEELTQALDKANTFFTEFLKTHDYDVTKFHTLECQNSLIECYTGTKPTYAHHTLTIQADDGTGRTETVAVPTASYPVSRILHQDGQGSEQTPLEERSSFV